MSDQESIGGSPGWREEWKMAAESANSPMGDERDRLRINKGSDREAVDHAEATEESPMDSGTEAWGESEEGDRRAKYYKAKARKHVSSTCSSDNERRTKAQEGRELLKKKLISRRARDRAKDKREEEINVDLRMQKALLEEANNTLEREIAELTQQCKDRECIRETKRAQCIELDTDVRKWKGVRENRMIDFEKEMKDWTRMSEERVMATERLEAKSREDWEKRWREFTHRKDAMMLDLQRLEEKEDREWEQKKKDYEYKQYCREVELQGLRRGSDSVGEYRSPQDPGESKSQDPLRAMGAAGASKKRCYGEPYDGVSSKLHCSITCTNSA